MSVNPVAFTIGSFPVHWYGILIASAVLIGTMLAVREAEKKGYNQDHFFNIILVSLPAAFIGARLYYVLFNWGYYSQNLKEIPATWQGGLAIHGGLIAAFLAAWLMLKKYRMSFFQGLDIAAPSIVLGQAIGRWGNYFNQEAYGYTVDSAKIPWAMYIDGAYRHPTFLYESLWNLGVFVFLLWLRRKENLKSGDIFLSYALLYSVGRFIIEGFRTDSLMLFGIFRAAQVVSALVIIVTAAYLYLNHRKKPTPDAGG